MIAIGSEYETLAYVDVFDLQELRSIISSLNDQLKTIEDEESNK